jgi:hypothetical protein
VPQSAAALFIMTKEELIQDFNEGVCFWGNQTFNWAGNDYLCIPSSAPITRELERGGYSVAKKLTLTVSTDQFTSARPISQDPNTLTFRNVVYAVMTAGPDTLDAILTLECVSADRGG